MIQHNYFGIIVARELTDRDEWFYLILNCAISPTEDVRSGRCPVVTSYCVVTVQWRGVPAGWGCSGPRRPCYVILGRNTTGLRSLSIPGRDGRRRPATAIAQPPSRRLRRVPGTERFIAWDRKQGNDVALFVTEWFEMNG